MSDRQLQSSKDRSKSPMFRGDQKEYLLDKMIDKVEHMQGDLVYINRFLSSLRDERIDDGTRRYYSY